MGDFRRLLNYVRPFWTSFLFALIAMFVTAVFETATAALLAPIFDQFLPCRNSTRENTFRPAQPYPKE
jgi:ABC-type multidrug transport system fused ATPase/permease subunit